MKAAKPRNEMNAALEEPGRARLRSCQSRAIKNAALAAEGVAVVFRRVAQILIATLREIFDEAAYARFLQRHPMKSSPQAYAHFLRERESAAARRIRCC